MFWFEKRQLVIPNTMETAIQPQPWKSGATSSTLANRLSMGAHQTATPYNTKKQTIVPPGFIKIHTFIKDSTTMEGKSGSFQTRSDDSGDDFCKYELERHAEFTTSPGSKDLALRRFSRPGPITKLENKQRAELGRSKEHNS
ncbi:MAG: hypothetical protein JEZ12_18170 [Desulfobacterium sp.]|nr:hypothetical protein [Desulfobacterium sp.]